MKFLRASLLTLASGLAAPVWAQTAVSLEAARDALQSGTVRVIDVRETKEHADGVAQGAALLPMSQLPQRMAELPPKHEPLLLICRTQNRSRATAAKLLAAGYTRVQFVQGGMSEWVRRGWPTIKP